MNTTKTRIISYDSMQSVAPVVDDSFNFKTIKSNLATFKQEVVNPKKISKINPNIDYFPVYYKKEIRASFIKLLIWIIILLISTTGFALGL
ncbi:hypothetical protein FACS189459_5740 [Bacilli bacterium]|nr:hypothetical protein FACS189459_5740 [Bacilli bacterium]